MHRTARTPSESVPPALRGHPAPYGTIAVRAPRPRVRRLLAACLLPLAACASPDGLDLRERELTVDELAPAPAAPSTGGGRDVAGSNGAGQHLVASSDSVAGEPAAEAYLRSPAYQRYRAYLARERLRAARVAEARARGIPASELPADELPVAELAPGDLSDEELLDGDVSDATVAAIVLPPGSDDLVTYANRCDAATGIHVPPFNCNLGTEIPQGVIQTTLTDQPIGMSVGSRDPQTPSVTSNTIHSPGSDIWNNADQFYFSYVSGLQGGTPDGTLAGVDGYAEVYVSGLQNTHAFAKAGVMFRDGLAPGAVNVMLAITPTSGAEIQKRFSPNGTSTNQFLTGRAAPTWLRLVRRTNTFTGFVSTDRITWSQVGDPVVFTGGFTNTPLVGLAVSSHVGGTSTEAVFDRFSWTPLRAGVSCDQPNALHGTCDPGSRFQVLAQTPDASVVANCRKQNPSATASPNAYGDVAVIQYNKTNGAVCFYQAFGVTTANAMPAPSTGNAPWKTPQAVRDEDRCTGCHDSGGFIRSPYLTQLNALPNMQHLLPNKDEGYTNGLLTELKYVGRDYVADKSWSVNTPKDATDTDGDPSDGDYGNCNSCHRLAVNNVMSNSGTAASFSILATEQFYGSRTLGINFKTGHGPTSPIWMRPEQITHQPGAELTAEHFSDCANDYWGGLSEGFSVGNDNPTDNCTFQALGLPFEPFADSQDFTDVNIGITGGTRTPNGMLQQLKAAGSDIFNNDDHFLYSYKMLVGDGSATVKVTSLTDTNAFAKAGLMFRDGTAVGAVNTMVQMTPSGAQFQYRNTVNGTTTSSSPISQAFPRWLKIARAGRTFVGYVSADQVSWTQVAAPVTLPAANFPPDALAMVGLAVTSHNANVQTTANFDHFAWLPATNDTLLDANIGINNGSHSFRAGKHTIQAGGNDIYNMADQFFFAFKSKGGTGSISAKVNSIGNTDSYAKAGVMFRNSALDNSANVMIEITAGQGAIFQYRPVLGASSTAIIVPGYSAPRSVRLDREGGGVFKGYVQENDGNWTKIGEVTLPSFNDPALVGLAVTSHNTGAVTTGTFSEVSLP